VLSHHQRLESVPCLHQQHLLSHNIKNHKLEYRTVLIISENSSTITRLTIKRNKPVKIGTIFKPSQAQNSMQQEAANANDGSETNNQVSVYFWADHTHIHSRTKQKVTAEAFKMHSFSN
jgi:hypothetical protein